MNTAFLVSWFSSEAILGIWVVKGDPDDPDTAEAAAIAAAREAGCDFTDLAVEVATLWTLASPEGVGYSAHEAPVWPTEGAAEEAAESLADTLGETWVPRKVSGRNLPPAWAREIRRWGYSTAKGTWDVLP